jgi:hypothetical protein
MPSELGRLRDEAQKLSTHDNRGYDHAGARGRLNLKKA